MFETIPETLLLLGYFAVIGFFLGALYEPVRIFRSAIRHGTAAVFAEDFLFLTLSALLLFAYSMELGSGEFRLYYVSGALFGAAVYFVTIGMLIRKVTKGLIRLCKKAVRTLGKYIVIPIAKHIWTIKQKISPKFGQVYKNVVQLIKIPKIHLKSKRKIGYNEINSSKETGEKRNVVKAEVKTFP